MLSLGFGGFKFNIRFRESGRRMKGRYKDIKAARIR
jgi:hypothetical protein